MKAEPQGQPTSINMELGEKEAEGIYSNFVVISHSLSEFVLDFARILPGNPKSKVFARVVMTPPNVRSLLKPFEPETLRDVMDEVRADLARSRAGVPTCRSP